MGPRFRADWDKFDSVEDYERFTEAWLPEAMRCLHERGSLFIFCSYRCVSLIGRMLQMKAIDYLQHIQVIKTNGRLVVNAQFLQHSHHTSSGL
jgi:modification methylase